MCSQLIILKCRTYLSFVFLIIIGFASCKKDDIAQPLPQITEPGLANGKDTLELDEKILLHPKLNDRVNTTYEWKVNGIVKSVDSTYDFAPDTAGNFTIDFKATNTSGQITFQYLIHVWEKYQNGIIMVNEGWFGHEKGNVNFYRYGRDTIEHMVYQKENPGKDLGTTTQYAAIWEGKLYMVSKQGPLVVVNAKTMKETGRIDKLPANGRAFLGIDASNGIISTANGLYPINLNTLVLGARIAGLNGETGTMRKEGNYIYVITQAKGLVILNASDYTIAKQIAGVNMGLSKTLDGSLWVAGGSSLVKINPTSLDTSLIVMPFALGNPWFAWNDGTLTASSKSNNVFIGRTMSWGAGGNKIYRYVPGNTASLNTPLATVPTNQEFYGSGARYNPVKDELMVTTVQSGYGDNYAINHLYFYDVNTGDLKKTVAYDHFYFPSMILFPQ